jgi:predicted AAA+ superfamily ATPase
MADDLARRLREPRRFLQVVAGPRQVGKTTLVRQMLADWPGPSVYASADEPSLRDAAWLRAQWERARLLGATDAHPAENGPGAVLVIDEVQKVRGWCEAAKRLWDEDSQAGRALRVVLLGSAPLPMQQGLTESPARPHGSGHPAPSCRSSTPP